MENQDELFKPDFGWFHFFRTLIRDGTWGKMSLAAAKLYPVIKSYCNAENGAAFPSTETLCIQAGLTRNSVTKGLKELVTLELVSCKHLSGKPNIYRLRELFDATAPGGESEPVSFPYIPQQVSEAVEQLKAFVASGSKGNILQFNITLNTGTGEQTVNNSIDGGDAIRGILEELERLGKLVDNSQKVIHTPPS